MKKIFALSLTFLMVLGVFCGCKPQNTEDISSQITSRDTTSSSNTVILSKVESGVTILSRESSNKSSSETPISSPSVNNSSDEISSINFNQATGKYLSTNPSKNSTYNEAIMAYDLFLSGKINAIDIETNKTTPLSDYFIYFGNDKYGISSYTLYDITGDGVPELHIGAHLHYVFTYQDNQIKYIYCSPTSAMNASIKLLENGAIFTEHDSAGVEYYYVTFNSDLSKNLLYFTWCDTDYRFEGKTVSKAEWDKLTKEYFNIPEAKVTWHQWNKE